MLKSSCYLSHVWQVESSVLVKLGVHFGCRIASFVIAGTTKTSYCSVMAVTVATILTVSVQKWKTFLKATGE